MLDVIRKTEYWEALDNPDVFRKLGGFTLKALDGLKHIQDAWTLNRLIASRGARVLEVGGGLSRVLPALDASNECWNLDEFRGEGNGVTDVPAMPGVKLVRRKLGDHAVELPDAYFDLVFSISVIEHLPWSVLDAFWKDHARVMKVGAQACHTIDLYLGDEPEAAVESRLKLYREMPARHGLELLGADELPSPLAFRCSMASNSDWGMWRWNKNAPSMVEVRKVSQSVSLRLVLRRVR